MKQNKLRELRRHKNLTQENIAVELGITQKAYSKIENGDVCISEVKLLKLSKILHVSISDICPNACVCFNSNNKLSLLLDYLSNNNIEIPQYLK